MEFLALLALRRRSASAYYCELSIFRGTGVGHVQVGHRGGVEYKATDHNLKYESSPNPLTSMECSLHVGSACAIFVGKVTKRYAGMQVASGFSRAWKGEFRWSVRLTSQYAY